MSPELVMSSVVAARAEMPNSSAVMSALLAILTDPPLLAAVMPRLPAPEAEMVPEVARSTPPVAKL